jgi:hypothetical protein
VAKRICGTADWFDRRECIDHVVVLGERHLRHLLLLYRQYYNETRTHLSLDKDAPIPRAVEAIGRILSGPVLGGLHHQRIASSICADLICDRDSGLKHQKEKRSMAYFAAPRDPDMLPPLSRFAGLSVQTATLGTRWLDLKFLAYPAPG